MKSGFSRTATRRPSVFLDRESRYSLDHLFVSSAPWRITISLSDRVSWVKAGGAVAGDGPTVPHSTCSLGGCSASPSATPRAGLKGFRREVAEHLFGLQRIPGLRIRRRAALSGSQIRLPCRGRSRPDYDPTMFTILRCDGSSSTAAVPYSRADGSPAKRPPRTL